MVRNLHIIAARMATGVAKLRTQRRPLSRANFLRHQAVQACLSPSPPD